MPALLLLELLATGVFVASLYHLYPPSKALVSGIYSAVRWVEDHPSRKTRRKRSSSLEVAKRIGSRGEITILEKNWPWGRRTVFINSLEAIEHLTSTHPNLLASRPHYRTCGDLLGWKNGMALSDAGPRWKFFREICEESFGPKAVGRYESYFEHAARRAVLRSLATERQGGLLDEFEFVIERSMLDLLYGLTARSPHDEYIKQASAAARTFNASISSQSLIDSTLFHQLLPSWFRSDESKRQVEQWRSALWKGITIPFDRLKADLLEGVARPSLIGNLLQRHPPNPAGDNEALMWFGGSIYAGALEPLVSTLSVFVRQMGLHPEIQAKARNEIEAVTGNGRLPSFDDRHRLPYVEAVMKEVLRWDPVMPLGLGYRCGGDAHFRGETISEEDTVLPNIWALSHDPDTYPEPDEFRPERFLDDSALPDPRDLVYGFGPRMCPGMHLADTILWTVIATTLATVRITEAKDGEVRPEGSVSGRLIRAPDPLSYHGCPTSDAVLGILREVVSVLE